MDGWLAVARTGVPSKLGALFKRQAIEIIAKNRDVQRFTPRCTARTGRPAFLAHTDCLSSGPPVPDNAAYPRERLHDAQAAALQEADARLPVPEGPPWRNHRV